MKRIAILVSNKGWGTNPRAIINAINSGKINGKVVVVVSPTDDAPAYLFAKKNGITTHILNTNENIVDLLTKKFKVDYIALAGWPKIIPEDLLTTFPNKILNIHPGLIPDNIGSHVENPDGTAGVWNKGKLTNNAMKNFLDSKTTYAGCSLHFLTNDLDFGPVLGRSFEKINKNDTIDSLYKRLKKKENRLYVSVLKNLCQETKK